MNIDDRPTTDLRAYSHILGKFQMTIQQRIMVKSLKRVIQFTVCTQIIFCPRTL